MFLGTTMVLQLDITGGELRAASGATMLMCCDTTEYEECEG